MGSIPAPALIVEDSMSKTKEYQRKYYLKRKASKSGSSLGDNAQTTQLLRKLDGQRGMIAINADGAVVYASNKTDKNGSLKIAAGTWKNSETLIFTTGKRDPKGAVVPSSKYVETFADSSATKMIVRSSTDYTIEKAKGFDSAGFKKESSKVHVSAKKDLQRKANIINKAYKEQKMTSDEVVTARKRANKEYTDAINNFYKDKKAQKRYGFKLTHS